MAIPPSIKMLGIFARNVMRLGFESLVDVMGNIKYIVRDSETGSETLGIEHIDLLKSRGGK